MEERESERERGKETLLASEKYLWLMPQAALAAIAAFGAQLTALVIEIKRRPDSATTGRIDPTLESPIDHVQMQRMEISKTKCRLAQIRLMRKATYKVESREH